MQLKSAFVLACVAGIAASAGAQNDHPVASAMPGNIVPPQTDAEALWDQSAFDNSLPATVDQEFGGNFPTYDAYAVEDFTTGDAAWNVTSISTYFTVGFGRWSTDIIEGRLQVYSKDGSLPSAGDVPPEYKIGVRLTDGGGYWIVSADTSDIAELQGIHGDYWIGLTPVADFEVYGQEYHLNMPAFYGEYAAVRNPGGAFGLGTEWFSNTVIGGTENAFKLEGEIAGGDECYADLNGDTVLDLFDFLEFTNLFNAGDDLANCDGQGGLDLFDFLCYTNAFNAGC